MLTVAAAEFARDGFAIGAPFSFKCWIWCWCEIRLFVANGGGVYLRGCKNKVPLAVAVTHDTGVKAALADPVGAYTRRGDSKQGANATVIGCLQVLIGGLRCSANALAQSGFWCVLHDVSPSVWLSMGKNISNASSKVNSIAYKNQLFLV